MFSVQEDIAREGDEEVEEDQDKHTPTSWTEDERENLQSVPVSTYGDMLQSFATIQGNHAAVTSYLANVMVKHFIRQSNKSNNMYVNT